MLYPNIKSIKDLEVLREKKEIRFMEMPNGTTVVCYMVDTDTTFDSRMAHEARGITFDSHGKVLMRPLSKFFNVNQRPETMLDQVRGMKLLSVMDKVDGSMITTAVMEGKVVCKSKKSFTSDVAVAAQKYINANKNVDVFARACFAANHTPIFEYTSPAHRIVINYEEECMTLLHIRHNETGKYLSRETVRDWANLHQIPVVESYHQYDTIDDLVEAAKTMEGIEGWVAELENGDFVKVKTVWYMNLHKTVTFLRVRDVVEMVVDQQFDDLIGIFAITGFHNAAERAINIKNEVIAKIEHAQSETEKIVSECKNKQMSVKDVAIAYKSHHLFSLIMCAYRNGQNDYYEWFKRRYLQDYSLDVITSMS